MERKLTPVATSVMELCKSDLSEDATSLVSSAALLARIFNAQLRNFNREQNRILFTKGLEVSPYFVGNYPGYAGIYLN